MNFDYLKIIITIVLAVIGWLVAHHFTNKRTIDAKRRELVTQHLIESYRVLTTEISERESTEVRNLKLENMISDIQLFGSKEQITLAKKLANDISSNGKFEMDPLINCLRNDLRKNLNLEEIEGNVTWLRKTS